MVSTALVLACVLTAMASPALAQHDAFRIHDLPGAPDVNFKQYSGYITFNETHGRNMFFWFVESQNSPSTDPVVLWLNGGPGCSSLGGLLSENGPFFAGETPGTLVLNDYSWNRNANVLYLESPSGVGFSTSKTHSDYKTGDAQTAQDTLDFLLLFFAEFSEFAKRDFYISGESYGGHYTVNAAREIVMHNEATQDTTVNIKGVIVGNAWTDAALDNQGAAFDWYTHALNSRATYDGMVANCNFSTIGPLMDSAADTTVQLVDPKKCDFFQEKANEEMGPINIYEIYEDVCLSGDNGNQVHALLRHLARAHDEGHPQARNTLARFAKSHLASLQDGKGAVPPCIDSYLANYLNNKTVQAAIHAEIPYAWTMCSNIVDYSRKDLLTSVVPVYDFLFARNLRIVVYSGDHDGILPTCGTRAWIAAAGWPIKEAWKPWQDSAKQTGGYTVLFEHARLVTVRGAGHMVPGTQPLRAFDMITKYLNGEW